MRRPLPCGPFDLTRRIGRGGMGEVWRGVHRTLGLPVAVKVMAAPYAREPRHQARVRDEIRFVAALDHRSIVRIYEYGVVPDEAERVSRGRLRAGSPFLALELVEGGDFGRLCGRLAWPALRDVLLRVLDALAHAHARGVLHLDLKPGNVLRAGAEGEPKLTDFGLGHALDRPAADSTHAAGTPAYMAPEQALARWRDFGPWTDLYGMGCLAYALAAGAAPFSGLGSPRDIVRAQLHTPPPPLPPGAEYPDDFGRWLWRLLDKEPMRRFRCAADAARALEAIAGPEGSAPPTVERAGGSWDVPTLSLVGESTSVDSSTLVDTDGTAEDSGPPAMGASSTGLFDPPPPSLPPTWTDVEPGPPESAQRGLGLGLFGLRLPPLVDRGPERDALWAALRRVSDEGGARLVVVRGSAGCGKSRLVAWLAERAAELGAALVLRARHGPTAGVDHGLGPMIGRFARCEGLDRDAIRERFETLLYTRGAPSLGDAEALTELVAPGMEGRTSERRSTIRFQSPVERYALVRRFIGLLGAERPVLLWLDDAQWGPDSLAFVDHLLVAEDDAPLPVLVVATVQDEALADQPGAARLLEGLLARPRVESVRCPPLPAADQLRLVRDHFGLEDDLAALVADRTGGNPLFAVQLVGDWVERGLLAPAAEGFRLARAGAVELPDDLYHVWTARIERVLEARPEADGHALELAAVLGRAVDESEWRAACRRRGCVPGADLLDVLLDRRLAIRDPGDDRGAWSFVHEMLREALERRAREAGRDRDHHRACAAMLAEREGRVDDRRARHLLAAGDHAAALAPLERAARLYFYEGDYRQAEGLVRRHREAVEAIAPPAADARWGETWLLSGEVAQCLGALDESESWVRRAEEAARRHGWRSVLSRSLEERARIAWLRGRAGEALRWAEAAEREAAALTDPVHAARCRRLLAVLWLDRGDADLALTFLEQARAAFEALGDSMNLAHCYMFLGRALASAGRLEEAEAAYDRAQRVYDRSGSRWGAAEALGESGDLLRWRGDIEGAADRYRRAMEGLEALGSPDAIYARIHLGLAYVESGAVAGARALLEESLERMAAAGLNVGVAMVHVALAACAAAEEDWTACDRRLVGAADDLRRSGYVNVDVARMAERCAERARDAGRATIARRARAIATAQRRKLGRAPG